MESKEYAGKEWDKATKDTRLRRMATGNGNGGERGGNGVENTGVFKLRNQERGKEKEGIETNC